MLLSTGHTNNLPASKGNDRRGLVALLFGLAILFGVASAPVVVYYFMPPNTPDTDFRVQVVSTKLLEKSVCKSAFQQWNWFAIETTRVNISIADCGNFSKAEKDLIALFQSASSKNLPQSFMIQYTLNVCRYVYRKHDRRNKFSSREPMCDRNESFVSEGVSLSCLSLSNCTHINCTKPLLYTKNKFAREHGFYCSLPCDERAWRNPVIINTFYGSYYVSVAIFWPCIAVIAFTWFKVKEMLCYQSTPGLLFALSYAVVVTATMFPDVWGKNKVYCKHDDIFDSWKDPTKLCQIQGLMGQFGLVLSLMWWASSVCNTLLSLYKCQSNYSHRRRKIVFFAQLTLALIVPGGLTTFSIVHGVQYTRNTYQTILCTPSSYSSLFYVNVLPSTIIIYIGTFASSIVIYKLYQAKKSIYLRDYVANNSEISFSQKRFFVLFIFVPLSYSVTMTSTMTTNKSFLRHIKNDVECLEGSPKCKTNDATMGMCIVLSFALWNAIVIAGVVYCLTQYKGARAYWFQVWKKATSHKWMQKQADEMEGPTENTRLFTSDKSSSSKEEATDTGHLTTAFCRAAKTMLHSTARTNNLPDSKENDGRGLVALLFGLAILFGVASAPVVVYYFMPPNQLDTDFNATRVQVVSAKVLEKSVCKSAFRHWNWFAIKTSSVNISIADCGNFSKAEQDLEALFQSASTKNLPRSFIRQYTLNACRYVYQKHDRRNEFLSREPMCERNESFVSEGVSLSCLSLSNCTRVNCSKPLLYTENKFAREHGFYCSLPCEERAWRNPVIINLFYGSYYVSAAIFWPCIAVIVFTWFKVKEMFSYQSVTDLLFALSYAVVAIATMFPLFWGQNKVYCKYDDLFDSWKDPTKLCQIQGLMGQFGLVSSLMWWASSVCNTLLSLFWHSSYSHRQRKIVFFAQLTLALIVPGSLTTFSIVHGVQYTRNSYQTTLCTPSSYSSLFYVSVLPSTIIIYIGTFASAFVIYKLYQAKKLIYLRDCVANNSEISLSQKRFFVLSIFIPLSYSVIMTSAMTTNESFLRNIQNDMECLKGSPKCKDNDTTTGMFIVLGFALWNAIVIAAMVYCLTQHKGARAYWLQIWKRATSRKWMQKKADEMEGPTETTRLFTDRTLSSS